MRVNPGMRAEESLDELLFGHFQTEERDRRLVHKRRVLDYIGRERALSHRRASRNDDKIRFLKPGRLDVEVPVAGTYAGNTLFSLI